MVKKKRKANKWILHVQKVSKENKGMAFKDILKKAKKSYTKLKFRVC